MVANLFGRRKPKKLEDLSYDELRLEKAKLEASEKKTLRDLQALEKDKTTLFEEARREMSGAIQQVKARKIRDITHRIDGLQGNLRRLGKLIQVVDLTMARLEQGRLQGDPNLIARIIGQTDTLSIQEWVDGVISGEAVAEQKLDEVLKAFGDAELMQSGVATGDAEVDAILAEIQRAAAVEALAAETSLPERRETETPEA